MSFFSCSAPLASSTLTVVKGTPRAVEEAFGVLRTRRRTANVYERDRKALGCLRQRRSGRVVLDEIGRQALRLDLLESGRRRPVGVDDACRPCRRTGKTCWACAETPAATTAAATPEDERNASGSGLCHEPLSFGHSHAASHHSIMPQKRVELGRRPRNATNDSSASRLPPRGEHLVAEARARRPADSTPSSSNSAERVGGEHLRPFVAVVAGRVAAGEDVRERLHEAVVGRARHDRDLAPRGIEHALCGDSPRVRDRSVECSSMSNSANSSWRDRSQGRSGNSCAASILSNSSRGSGSPVSTCARHVRDARPTPSRSSP